MAKQWFFYALSTTTYNAQITAVNYLAIGTYPGAGVCVLADRTCLLYTYTSSGIDALPSPRPGAAPAISTKLQSYIAMFTTGGSPVVHQPVGSKKYLYVHGG